VAEGVVIRAGQDAIGRQAIRRCNHAAIIWHRFHARPPEAGGESTEQVLSGFPGAKPAKRCGLGPRRGVASQIRNS
jgi:hypothetical protein